jgi:hypothetical protein
MVDIIMVGEDNGNNSEIGTIIINIHPNFMSATLELNSLFNSSGAYNSG